MRQLKFHEQKLLKKVNFLEWGSTNTTREHLVISKYQLKDREEYAVYHRIASKIRSLAEALVRLKDTEEVKVAVGRKLISKLYSAGVISNKRLIDCSKVTVSSFCERRLPMLMKRSRMVSNFRDAARFVEHGHVRLGPKVVSDSSVIVSRAMEDFIQWVDGSKIKRKIDEFNEQQDDYTRV
jgi:U3 small nucleolar ribonucleoprotein protein IMP3